MTAESTGGRRRECSEPRAARAPRAWPRITEQHRGVGSHTHAHQTVHGQTHQLPPSAALHPKARLSQVLLWVVFRSCLSAGLSQTRDCLVSATGTAQPQAPHPSSAGAIQEEWVPCQLPKSGSSSGTPQTQIIPPAAASPPDSQSSPGLPTSPAGGPTLCCTPSDAEAVTAISLLISNLSAPKHAWTDISVDNWENQDLSLCKELLLQGGTAPAARERVRIYSGIGEEAELNTQTSPRAQLPPGALALPWHSVWGSSSAASKAKKSGLSWAPGLCEPSWHRRCPNSVSFPRTLAKGV